ncbi:hypothetical protein [Spirosoma utsteinense]|uniref:Outer membrane protein beta-barrel domain-containing protein n=1 Tax=Spirosoma utsteinense TaxID=2585773 RepID=A0ABR6W244_9BACT|nr:hypothetical protein [Spirosoma utsteinense]MBC3783629.1 hypothetical protein [Spirosoma utsteinense]MBC3790228.1 hypothetical protein [Spirosoma utsteinense]
MKPFITGFLFLMGWGIPVISAVAQIDIPRRPFVNYTEFGGLFGRVSYQANTGVISESVDNKLSLTAQTFNGVQLTRQLAVGGVVGIDWYRAALLMPVGAGIRFDFVRHPRKNVRLFGMADAGYSLAWLHRGSTGYETKGGWMMNPGLGLRVGRPLSSGSAFIMTVSYKRQEATVSKPIAGNDISRHESRVYNRLALRFGLTF